MNEDYTRLTRSFYLNNIFCATEFVKNLYEVDSTSTQQIPNVHIIDQDIVRVELHTKPLKGLSYRDLELATIIDSFDFKRFEMLPLLTEKGYKKEIRRLRIEEEMKAMEAEIMVTEGTKKFPNKFKQSVFDLK